jgi:hypothetical protein
MFNHKRRAIITLVLSIITIVKTYFTSLKDVITAIECVQCANTAYDTINKQYDTDNERYDHLADKKILRLLEEVDHVVGLVFGIDKVVEAAASCLELVHFVAQTNYNNNSMI